MAFIPHHHFIDRVAFLNGIVGGIALYPQVWKLFANGSAVGISLSSFVLIFINSVVWLLYSMHRSLISLAIASSLNIIASGILIGAILLSW